MPLVLQVPHLPEASSFFLPALQPLGYRYISGRRGSVGLGIHSVDFLLEQADFGKRPRPSKIRFHAPSRAAVREFYAAALYAGARPVLSPGDSHDEKNAFNAQILDRDGNNIEVTFTDPRKGSLLGSDGDQSGVLAWQKDVAKHPGSEASVARSKSGRTGIGSKHGATDSSRKSVISDIAEDRAKSTVTSTSRAGAKPDSVTEEIPRVESQQNRDIMPGMIRQLSGGIESLLTKANNVSGVIEKKTVVGTALGAVAGAAIAYAMCTSEDGKIKHEQYQITKWDNDGRPVYSHSSRGGDKWNGVAQSTQTQTLPELMSRLAIEPPAPPQAPEPPTSRRQLLLTDRPSERSTAGSSSRRRSASVTSRHTIPARSRSHASRSSRRRSTSAHGSRHAKHNGSGSSHASMTLVNDDYDRASGYDKKHDKKYDKKDAKKYDDYDRASEYDRKYHKMHDDFDRASEFDKQFEKKYDAELDLDDVSVAPSDSISMAGDKYSRSGMMRASHGKRRDSSYGGETLGRIIENDRESDARLSARRVTRAYY